MTMRGKRTHHRVNEAIPLDFSDATPEGGAAKTQGVLLNFVRRGGAPPRWGKLHTYDTVANLLKAPNKTFTPNEVGQHTVVMVYFEQGKDGVWRFVHLATDPVRVHP
jgi:hypothetical protein